MPAALPDHARSVQVLPHGVAQRVPEEAAERTPALPDIEPRATAALPSEPIRPTTDGSAAPKPAAPVALRTEEIPAALPDDAPVPDVLPRGVSTRVAAASHGPTIEAPPAHKPEPGVPATAEAPEELPSLERLVAAVPATPEMSEAAAPRASSTQLRTDPVREREPVARQVAAPLRAALADAPKDRPNRLEITVRLDPPELGAVRLHVVARGESVHVTMHAESPEAVVALNDRRHDVVELLRQDGFSLDGFDIDTHDGNHRRDDAPAPSRNRTEHFSLSPEPEPEHVAHTTDNELRL
jgi:hypothetical protein